ncbi:MAG: primosomal protein N' [Clostridia bacterium]|nr:primosomal protein N' [Clostridia bacterium]
MADTARVFIIDAAYQADRPYDYYIPPDMRDAIVPGVIAEVPFGRGNRKMAAVVFDTFDSDSGSDGAGIKMKPLLPFEGAAPSPVLNREGLDLCLFLKNYTLCTFGDAVRASVPAAAMARMEEVYRVAENAGDAVAGAAEKLGEKAAFVFAAISAKQDASKEYLRSKFGDECTEILPALIKAGLIEKRAALKEGGSNTKYETVVTPSAELAEKAEEDGSYIEEFVALMKSRRQAEVLAETVASPGVTDGELSSRLGLDLSVVRTCLSALTKKRLVETEKRTVWRTPAPQDDEEFSAYGGEDVLSDEQSGAYEKLKKLCFDPEPRAALLHGVTGSGKTNVIMKLIEDVLAAGKGVIMLVPEIALTAQTVGRFRARFGDRVALIHSGLSAGERYDEYRRLRDGEASVAIGTRSAIFAPIPDIGLIVIDEEHEHTYKSDTSPKYLAHDVARFRCGRHGAMMLLASATPSVTSYYKAKKGVYTLVEMNQRYGGAGLPKVEICDMRAELSAGNTSPLSRLLIRRVGEGLAHGKQSILFLNRRGYNNYISCRSCGKPVLCPNCSVSLTYHVTDRSLMRAGKDSNYLEVRRGAGYLSCHTCGYRTAVPDKCPECSSDHFLFLGCGTQLAEDHLMRVFPDVKVLRMDHDTTGTKNAHDTLLSRFRKGEANVLLGTQMVTKGHDFPGVTTVGVLNADSSMFSEDYRAAERTFSMLTQVTGRSGRGEDPGISVIQTCNPDNDVITLAAKQDYKSFYEREIRMRKALTFPPFCDVAVLTLSSPDEAFLNASAKRLSERIKEHLGGDFSDVKTVVFGPFEAPVYKVQNVCRLRFVIKCRLDKRTREMISLLLTEFMRGGSRQGRTDGSLRISADLNPSSM